MRYKRFEKVPIWHAVRPCDASVAFMIFAAVLVVMITGPTCHAATDMSQPIVKLPPTLSQFVAGIVTRSTDLNYLSEQDSEVFAFYRNTPVKEMTDGIFLALLRRPAETQISRQSWSTFFQVRTQNDPTGRWGDLRDYLEANLTSLTVFRMPRDAPYEAQYDLFAVGIFNGETVVGVQMFGVAT